MFHSILPEKNLVNDFKTKPRPKQNQNLSRKGFDVCTNKAATFYSENLDAKH